MRAGRAERAGFFEGKIKETGTTPPMFSKLLLSAHWLAGPIPAPRFLIGRAGDSRKALSLLDFDRHYRRNCGVLGPFRVEAHP